MSNYRPKGWEETLRGILDRFNVTYMNSDEGKLVEAGADAMLERLRKSPTTKRVTPEWGYHDNEGWLVFIPDEE